MHFRLTASAAIGVRPLTKPPACDKLERSTSVFPWSEAAAKMPHLAVDREDEHVDLSAGLTKLLVVETLNGIIQEGGQP